MIIEEKDGVYFILSAKSSKVSGPYPTKIIAETVMRRLIRNDADTRQSDREWILQHQKH